MALCKPFKYAVLYLFTLISTFALSQDEDYTFSYITENDDLPDAVVPGIIQDDAGFIWFATKGGLGRFSGYNFKNFRHDPSDPSSIGHDNVFCIAKDKKGNLWIGTEGGGVSKFNPITERFQNFRHSDADKNTVCSDEIYSILADSRGLIWMGSKSKGVSCYDPKSNKFTPYVFNPKDSANTIGKGACWNIFEDSKKNLWFSLWGTGLTKYNPELKKFKHYHYTESTVSSKYTGVAVEMDDGKIWFSNWGSGIDIYDPASDSFSNIKHRTDKNSLCWNEVWPMAKDHAGNIWLGTYGAALCRYNFDDSLFTNYPYEHGLLSYGDIWGMLLDRSDILWIGTDGGGVTKVVVKRKKFKHFRSHTRDSSTLGHNYVKPIFRDREGVLWVGDWKGHINKYDPETKTFKRHWGGQSYKISSMMEDDNGTFWVGTYRDGLQVFDRETGKFTKKFVNGEKDNTLSHNYVYDFLIDSKKRFWVATMGGLNLFDPDAGTFKRIVHVKGDKSSLSNDNVYDIFEDSKGNIWIGTKDGLNMMKEDGSFAVYRKDLTNENSLANNTIQCIFEDKKGNIWLGTSNGLSMFDPTKKSFNNYTTEDGLPSNMIKAILGDKNGNLWISTRKGISKYVRARKAFVNYDYRDGLQSSSFSERSCYQDEDGRMYFGGKSGMNVFYPHEILDNEYIPPLVITSFEVNGKKLELDTAIHYVDKIVLEHDQNDFAIQFAALNYDLPKKNQYRHRLLGYQDDWKNDLDRTYTNYTNLDPGEYTFQVIGSNNDRRWNDKGTSLKIIIKPPFWETTWFYIFQSAFFLSLLGFAIYYNRSNKHTALAKVLALLSLFMVFEYVFVSMEPFLDSISQGAPFFKVLLNLILALATIPVERLVDKRFVKDKKEESEDDTKE